MTSAAIWTAWAAGPARTEESDSGRFPDVRVCCTLKGPCRPAPGSFSSPAVSLF